MTTGQANYRTTSSGDYVVIGYWWENIWSGLNPLFWEKGVAEWQIKKLY